MTSAVHGNAGTLTLNAGQTARVNAPLPISLDELRRLPDPPSMGERHYPIRFDHLYDIVAECLKKRELNVTETVLAVSLDKTRLAGAIKIRDPKRDEFGMFLGLMGSSDQFIATKLGFGTNVFSCANTTLSAEYVISRKNTRWGEREMPKLVDHGVNLFLNNYERDARTLEYWMQRACYTDDAKSFLFDMIDRRVMPQTHIIGNIWKRVKEPDQNDHRKGTVYALMNAVTGAHKERQERNRFRAHEEEIDFMGMLKQRFPVPAELLEDIPVMSMDEN